MNKKQKNRKIVAQNKRNRMINRRYSSTIKSLSKLFSSKIKQTMEISKTEINQNELKEELGSLVSRLYKAMDKAVKKGVIHKNKAARKKSRIGKIKINNLY